MAKVLVIDDDETTLGVLQQFLNLAGHEMVEAKDGRSGIEAYKAFRPDVVITDMLMPEKKGAEVIQEIKRLAPAQGIVAVAGVGMPLLQKALELGATSVMPKPFRLEEVLDAVQICLDSISGSNKP